MTQEEFNEFLLFKADEFIETFGNCKIFTLTEEEKKLFENFLDLESK